MTTTPEQAPEEQPTNEETTGAVKKPTPKKKPATRKRKAATKKRKPSTSKKRAASKPEEPVDKIPSVEEIKEQFAEAAVEPTKKAIDTWQEIAGVAREGLKDLKEAGVGILSGFLGNKKKED